MDNYCLENGKKRLGQLGIDVIPSWCNDKLMYYDRFPDLSYWKTLPYKSLGYIKVPLKDVIGTSHASYSDKNWLENLGCLRRFSRYYTKEYCMNYFNSIKEPQALSFTKFGNKYFITQGNHRTHIARFLGLEHIIGTVIEYFFDFELYNTIIEYRQENLSLDLDYKNLKRGALWVIQIDTFLIYIHGYEMLKEFILLYKQTPHSWLKSLQLKVIKKLGFNFERDFIHVKDKKDFDNMIFKYIPAFKYNKLKSK